MAKSRNWTGLSEGQRRRYVSAGRTGTLTGRKGLTPAQVRKYYESGGSLSAGRGHAEELAAPRTATLRQSDRELYEGLPAAERRRRVAQDQKELERWRRSRTYPTWLPKNSQTMRNDTAAALSLIGTPPRNWRSVDIKRNENGSYSVLVTTKRGRKVSTILSDYDSLQEFGSLLRNPVAMGRTATEKRNLKNQWTRANGKPWNIDISIPVDTDPISMAPTPNDAKTKPTRGKALPRKRA